MNHHSLEELALLISKHSDMTEDLKLRAQKTSLWKLLTKLIVKPLLALKQLRHTWPKTASAHLA